MHKYIIVFFSVLVILSSCGDETPGGVIEKPQMISLLTELHVLDGSLYSVPQQRDSLYRYGKLKYVALFKKHHTTEKQFAKSFKYYSAHPPVMEEIYTTISANLKAKTDSLNNADKKAKKNALPQ